jgi:hypothetical protein
VQLVWVDENRYGSAVRGDRDLLALLDRIEQLSVLI